MPAKNFDGVSIQKMNTTTSNFFSFVSKPVIIRLHQFEIENFNSLSPADATTVTTISSEKDCRAELEQVDHEPDCFFRPRDHSGQFWRHSGKTLQQKYFKICQRKKDSERESLCLCVCVYSFNACVGEQYVLSQI